MNLARGLRPAFATDVWTSTCAGLQRMTWFLASRLGFQDTISHNNNAWMGCWAHLPPGGRERSSYDGWEKMKKEFQRHYSSAIEIRGWEIFQESSRPVRNSHWLTSSIWARGQSSPITYFVWKSTLLKDREQELGASNLSTEQTLERATQPPKAESPTKSHTTW